MNKAADELNVHLYCRVSFENGRDHQNTNFGEGIWSSSDLFSLRLYGSPRFLSGQLKHEVSGKALAIALNCVVEYCHRDIEEAGQVPIQNHLFASSYVH